ncbi:nucleotidyltransferase domain-containing protein [Chryseobacterium sp. sg2396]|uniref:nucleotidyltransferase domain-containing protein n=1 Tax=Chryseobacterium sp. sg2396 TaxID=3276280 RepID=UPI00367255D5
MENALEIFVNEWKTKNYVTGILLTGSYAIGLENSNSDVDIRLIFNSKQKKSIKGLTTINGYIFSYLGRSSEKTFKSFSKDFLMNNKFEARIFSIGKILYDEKNILEKLIETGKVYLETPFIQKKISKEIVNTNMYSIYSNKTFLESLPETSTFFSYHYYNFLRQTMKFYSLYLGYESFIDSKIQKIFIDEKYQRIYSWDKFPDQDFIYLWIDCLNKENHQSVILIYRYLEKKIVKIEEKQFTLSWYEV